MTSGSGIRIFLSAAFLAAFVFLAHPLPIRAQDRPELLQISAAIANGSVEEKRDALYQIRVLGTVVAAREAIPALSDASETVRAEAAATCALLPPDEAYRAIAPLLNDKETFVRIEAAFAMGTARAVGAVGDLSRMLEKDRKPEVRTAAATALGLIGDISAVNALTNALVSNKGTKRAFIRREAATAIGKIAESSRGIAPVKSVPESYLPSQFKTSVTNVDDRPETGNGFFSRAAAVLQNLLSSPEEPDEVRRSSAFALGSIGDPGFRAALTKCSVSSDIVLAEICREGLGKLAPSD